MKQLQVSILLTSDGTRTVAEAELDEMHVSQYGDIALVVPASGKGSSGRERGDKSNQSVGDDLATARALISLAAHLTRRANGAVRHQESIKAHRAEIAERKAAETTEDVKLDFAGYFDKISRASAGLIDNTELSDGF